MSNNNGINFPDRWRVLAALLLLTAWGCYQEVEGCLDVRASNFNVAADVACLDCCTFPELELIFQHRAIRGADTLNFNYDSVFYLPGFPANPFRIEQIRYYISDLTLETNSGALRVLDTIKLFERNSSDVIGTPYIDDFILVDRDFPSSYTVGTLLGTGTVSAIRFRLGLAEAVRQTDPEEVAGGHPLALATAGDNWLDQAGYVSNRVVFFRDTMAVDTLIIPIFEPIDIELALTEPFVIEEGADLSLQLFVDYLHWFEGVDIVNDPIGEIQSNIVSHVSNSFSFVGVK